ncbi:precorrin-8X methylmutase [Velocimicrobium porci]|uniref:Precorrin-8X methylmutase n=1 Tax=Velocimicrobium porci TaxID=2606634 RepID=A0A6L5XVV9_9FIRM|nr:precorrin-8X methylmutase [Velocimicrobium porci]MSS62488.1 precorrin-8X methylmutase [Velocimicrobium porci]
MKVELQNVLPGEIEKRSFELIEKELTRELDPIQKPIIKRVIHTTADFSYQDSLCFSEQVVEKAMEAIKNGAVIITDTNMAKAGVNKKALQDFGGKVHCFMAEDDVAKEAKEHGTTRAVASMNKAAREYPNAIFAIGNAPTALIRLYELIKEEKINPALVIGVPVGFVNVVESKELIMTADIPYIVARGRKGGSNVAASICNALLYMAQGRKLV